MFPIDSILGLLGPKVANPALDLYKSKMNRKAAGKKFMELFLQELRERGVDDEQIKKNKYQHYIGELIGDEEIRPLLSKALFIEQNVREDLPPSRFEIPQHYKQELLKSGQLDRDLNSEQVEQYRRQYLEKSAEPVLKAIESINCQRAVVLGDPGSGKSTLLQYLALEWADGKTERFPLLIELREYVNDRSKSPNFLDFYHQSARADWKFDRHKLDDHLKHKPSLVMFDGLDEVFKSEDYTSVLDEIANFATQQYPNTKIIVTSRVIGYNPDRLRGANFQHFTLQELDESQIEEFINRWYQLALGEEPNKELYKQRLKEAIDNSRAIANLADNPLLLTMMAILNRRQSLPKDRADLYEQASRVLLHHWDVDHKKLNLPLDRIDRQEKQAILRTIAYEMQSGEKGLAGNLIDSRRLKAILTGYLKDNGFDKPRETATLLVEQLRSRNFILCDRGADTYGFVHRTFLEYFCATEIVYQFNEERCLSPEQLRDDIFGQHWQDKAWHEVLRLICGLLAPKWTVPLVEFLMEREVDRSDYLDDEKRATKEAFQHLQLAIECCAEIRSSQLTAPIRAKLKDKLKKEIESESKILLSYDAAELILNSIVKYYHTESEILTWLQNFAALHDQHDLVRRKAVNSIAQHYHTQPEILTWLQNFALHDQSLSVQRVAVESIGQYYHTEPEILTWLQNFAALHDQHLMIRQLAVESIGQYYRTQPEILTWLQNIALHDQDNLVQQITVNSICRYYHTQPEILTWLQNLAALHEQHQFVRQRAVESIAQYYHTEPEILTWLQNFALHDQDGRVRGSAVESIGQYYRTKPETLTWLQNIALYDQDGNVRAAAVRSISQYYHTQPEILTWLQNFALHDQDWIVRAAAVKSIGKYYIQSDGIYELLCQIASQDPYQGYSYFNPRKAALEALVKHYIDRPEAIELLRDRSTQDPDKKLREWAEKQLKNIV
jgi:GTPase SAR1 family protein